MKKICVFTGTRANYGLLRPLMDKIKKSHSFQLQTLVSGSHLCSEFGSTYKAIEEDGYKISEKIDITLASDTPEAICKSIGLGYIGFGEAFSRLKPDLLIVLGDRFEDLCAATCAVISQIPIAHIHGGETTIGATDEAFRHSITKMSLLHFTSTEQYKKRVIQLGESPDRVYNVGAPGLDNIKNIRLMTKKELEKELNFTFNEKNLIITFHPVTLEPNSTKKQLKNLLKAVDELKKTNLIFTKSNTDTYGRIINKMIEDYTFKNENKAKIFDSLGQRRYLSTLQFVDAMVGNSSSGIIEAPSFKIGTINIGDRQTGRVRAQSIIDCKPDYSDIKKSLEKLYSFDFQKLLKKTKNPHGDGTATSKIYSVLKKFNFGTPLKKEFFNLNYNL